MATSPNVGLFGMLGDEASMQRQLDEQRAAQFANMSQGQRLASMGYRAGAGLGRGIAGLFGVNVTDPAIRRANRLRELASQYDYNTPEGLRQMAQALRQEDIQASSELSRMAQAMDLEQAKLGSEKAQTAQRMAAAGRERQQAIPADIQRAQRIAGLKAAIPAYEQAGDTPTAQMLKDELSVLTAEKETKQPLSELGKLIAERNALDPVKDKSSYDAYNAKIKKLTTGGGLGSEIVAGLSPLVGAMAKQQSEKAGAAAGTDVGKQSAQVQGKYTALLSVKDALDVVDRGIYAGGYGPMNEALAKYGAGLVGNKNRLVNTEEFRSLIGDVVIPRLQEFGGNDSVEELKYLRSVMAGETTLEPASIKRILTNADKKIRAGIKRLEAQQQAVTEGKPLPLGPLTKEDPLGIR